MHSSQNWTCFACVLFERFALRSPSSWIPRARDDGCRCPVSPLSRNRSSGAPEPPRLCRYSTEACARHCRRAWSRSVSFEHLIGPRGPGKSGGRGVRNFGCYWLIFWDMPVVINSSFCAPTPIKSGGRGLCRLKREVWALTRRQLDFSRRLTERSLVGDGCTAAHLHHARHLLVCASRAVHRAKRSTQCVVGWRHADCFYCVGDSPIRSEMALNGIVTLRPERAIINVSSRLQNDL
eukprot:2689175-Pleurochrysis_carterae.AAC.1